MDILLQHSHVLEYVTALRLLCVRQAQQLGMREMQRQMQELMQQQSAVQVRGVCKLAEVLQRFKQRDPQKRHMQCPERRRLRATYVTRQERHLRATCACQV